MGFTRLIEMLHCTSNLQTLELPLTSVIDTEYASMEKNESYKSLSNINNIKYVCIKDMCDLEQVKIIVNLCPQLEHFTTGIVRKDLEALLRFLLSNNISQLFFLCIRTVPKLCIRQVKKLIKSEKFFNDYLIKYSNSNLYLWW